MKIRDVKGKMNESLPPHLAKFVGDDGDWTPDAKRRLGKDGAERLSKTKRKAKDVTPKGYGPVEEDVNSFVKVDKRVFYDLENRGATFNPYTGGLYMNDKLIGIRDDATDQVGDGDRYFYDYLLSPEFAPEREVAEGWHDDKGRYTSTGTTTYLLKDPEGTDWTLFHYKDTPGSNPRHLGKMIDQVHQRLGWRRGEVIAQWKGDIDEVLADAQDKLASGTKYIHSYQMDLERKVRDLSKAKKVMSAGKEVHPPTTEGRDPRDVINNFLKQKEQRSERGQKLYKDREAEEQRTKEIDEAGGKIACLNCDAVSTAAAWKKNNGFCPKCKTSSQGVAEGKEDGRQTASAAVKRDNAARQRNINKAKRMMKRGFSAEKAAKEYGVRVKDLQEADYVPKGKRRPTQKDWYHMLAQNGYALDPNGIEQTTTGDPGYESGVNILNFTVIDPEGNDIGTGQMDDYFGMMQIELHTGQTINIDNAKHPLAKDAWSILDRDDLEENKPTDSDYAIGMAQAKKSTGDKPPLEKSTIRKAHKIAKAVAKESTASSRRMPTHEIMNRIERAMPDLKPYGVKEKVLGIVSDILYKADQGILEDSDPCWKGYRQLGMKKKNGKEVPNCVPESEEVEEGRRFKTAYGWAGGSKEPTKREIAAQRKRAEKRRKEREARSKEQSKVDEAKKVTPGRKVANLLQSNGWDVPFVDRTKNGYSLKIFGYSFRSDNPERQKEAEAKALDEKRQLESLLSNEYPDAKVKVVKSWVGWTEPERRSQKFGEYNIRVLVPVEAAPLGEAMPSFGKVITVSKGGKAVKQIKMQDGVKMHHLARELRAANLGLRDLDLTNAARELARGKPYSAGDIKLTVGEHKPRQF